MSHALPAPTSGPVQTYDQALVQIRAMRELIYRKHRHRICRCADCGARIVFVTEFHNAKARRIPVTLGDAMPWHTLWAPRLGHRRHACGIEPARKPQW
jgi:DICT domain-containing protein